MNARWIRGALVAIGMLLGPLAISAEPETVTGVVTSVNVADQTITVRNADTGRYRTYFIAPGSRITSQGRPIALGDVKRGNGVTLTFQRTDRGREITAARVPTPTQTVDVGPPALTGEQTLSGTITGVRPSKRTITIREAVTRERQTLNVPEGTRITSGGQELRLSDLERGDRMTARYRVTERGPVLVTGTAPTAAPAVAAAAEEPAVMTELPKTASNAFAFLMAGVGLLSLGLAARRARRRRT